MQPPKKGYSSHTIHAPIIATCCDVDDFCYITINAAGNHTDSILLTHRNGYDLLFLYQLREAVEQAFQFCLNKEP
jgi:hypothetical protein